MSAFIVKINSHRYLKRKFLQGTSYWIIGHVEKFSNNFKYNQVFSYGLISGEMESKKSADLSNALKGYR